MLEDSLQKRMKKLRRRRELSKGERKVHSHCNYPIFLRNTLTNKKVDIPQNWVKSSVPMWMTVINVGRCYSIHGYGPISLFQSVMSAGTVMKYIIQKVYGNKYVR